MIISKSLFRYPQFYKMRMGLSHEKQPVKTQRPGSCARAGLWGYWLLQRRWCPQVAAAAGGAAAAAFRGRGGDQGCLAQGGGGGVEPFPICLDQGREARVPEDRQGLVGIQSSYLLAKEQIAPVELAVITGVPLPGGESLGIGQPVGGDIGSGAVRFQDGGVARKLRGGAGFQDGNPVPVVTEPEHQGHAGDLHLGFAGFHLVSQEPEGAGVHQSDVAAVLGAGAAGAAGYA